MPRAPLAKGSFVIPAAVAGALFATGLFGGLSAAWGYGLFLMATLLVGAGAGVFLVFVLTRLFDTDMLAFTFAWLFRLGGWAYVFCVSALAGFFTDEALKGAIDARWIVFGPAALAAIIVLDWGLYRLLVEKNRPTWQRFGHLVSRAASDPGAMRRTMVDDVILHRALFSLSGFRWLKHTLIFWGFALMFAVEIIAVFVREAVPAFGWQDVWQIPGHPLRLAFDFAFDLSGLMVLTGCALALAWRVRVNGTAEQKFTDTPTAVFLFLVVLSGFAVEGLRISAAGMPATDTAAFAGFAVAALMGEPGAGHDAIREILWYGHVLGSLAFIAYVPAKRLIHSCATPLGRLMGSQTGLMAAKKEASLKGLLVDRDA